MGVDLAAVGAAAHLLRGYGGPWGLAGGYAGGFGLGLAFLLAERLLALPRAAVRRRRDRKLREAYLEGLEGQARGWAKALGPVAYVVLDVFQEAWRKRSRGR